MAWLHDITDDFERRDAEKERWLQSRPVCCICKEHIQDEQMICYNDKHCHPLIECEMEFWDEIRKEFLEDVD